MPKQYLVDTNTYYLFFQNTKSQPYNNLVQRLTENDIVSFYISEITSLEIYSVIGKYGRGTAEQHQICERKILADGVKTTCPNTWIIEGYKRLSPRLIRDLHKMVINIENQDGPIQATILPLNPEAMNKAKEFLIAYADRFKFGSLDALIAGTVKDIKETKGLQLTIITADRGFKAALSCSGIPLFDPNSID